MFIVHNATTFPSFKFAELSLNLIPGPPIILVWASVLTSLQDRKAPSVLENVSLS